MDKIAKYYLSVEGVVLLGILLSGFYDLSFLFFGVIYFGLILGLVGLVVSSMWCVKRLKSGGAVMWPFSFIIVNAVLFLGMISFVAFTFSGGIHFLM